MGNSNVKAGGAYVEISADNNLLATGLNKSGAMLKKFGDGVSSVGKQLSAVGAAVVVPLTAMAKLSADAGASLYDMSRRTGISTEALSRMGFVASLTGSDLDAVEVGIKRMQKTIAGVADVTEGTTGELGHLGITAQQIKDLSPDKQFELIASKISEIKDPTQRAAAAMKVFGRSGSDLIPMMESFDRLKGKADDFGLVRSGASARAAKEFTMSLTTLAAVTRGLNSAVASALIPTLKQKAEWMTRVTMRVRQLMRDNPQLIVTIFKVGTALVAGGGALYAFGKAAGYAGTGLKVVASVLTTLGSSPLLIVAGLAAVATYFAYTSQAGQRYARFLADNFTFLSKDAKLAFQGIADALASGDILLASQILWTSMEKGWLEFRNFLEGIFNAMGEMFVQVWINAVADVKKLIGKTFSGTLASAALFPLRAILGEKKFDLAVKGMQLQASALADTAEQERAEQLKTLENLRGKGGDPAEIEERKKKIEELSAALKGLRAQAAGERASAPALPALPDQPQVGSVELPTRQVGATSTFNAAIAGQLASGGGPTERTAKNTDDIKRNLDLVYRFIYAQFQFGGGGGVVS